ncbi:unnamed protein product [Urochloa decumbens]|uniref:Uncharacterized protein n=1 Tax=Urochloa decumbens TaxID=240449 RepID=A0ABC9FUV7_9POAL
MRRRRTAKCRSILDVSVGVLAAEGRAPEACSQRTNAHSAGWDVSGANREVEVVGVSSRSSFCHLHDVIQGFSQKKRELLRETGFDGFLQFPAIRQVDRRFVVWLMCRVDSVASNLVVCDDVKIKFDKADVNRVFGIPCAGKKVPENGRARKDVIARVMQDYFGIEDSKNRSIKVLQEVLERDVGDAICETDCVAFKVAFVIYVMATMLSPTCRFDYASVDYWGALDDPNEIGSYDWAGFVVSKLLAACAKMQSDLESTSKVPIITGCSLFLQVLYLDSIDLGVWSMDHSVLPRISCFPPDRLKCMIRLDTIKYTKDAKDRVFGRHKRLLPAHKVCYSWGCVSSGDVGEATDSVKKELRAAAVDLARMFDTSEEDVEPLVDSVAKINNVYGARIILAVSSFLERIVGRRKSEDEGGEMCLRSRDGEGSDCAYDKRGKRVADGDVVASVGSSCSNGGAVKKTRFGCEVVSRVATDRIEDPWELGFKFRYNVEDAARFVKEFGCVKYQSNGCGCSAGVYSAKLLERLICGEVEVDAAMVDAVIRAFKERDDELYAGNGGVRWRHFVELEIMVKLVDGMIDPSDEAVCMCFDSNYLGYDVGKSKVVFMPVWIGQRWVCYAWRLGVDGFVVFDPLICACDWREAMAFHEKTAKLIRTFMTKIVGFSSGGFNEMLCTSSFQVLELDGRFGSMHRSGLWCLYFCGMFDGEVIRAVPDMDDMSQVAGVILAEGLSKLRIS